jgi:hypothetical protein
MANGRQKKKLKKLKINKKILFLHIRRILYVLAFHLLETIISTYYAKEWK